ncbi:MAG: hypothetical protein U5N86_04715 [Planctomycetota bacterium]|nr:hypothetical protein [Planctomycetota bacterium]
MNSFLEDFEDYSEESDGRFWSADGARMNVADGAMHIEGGSVSYEHWNRVLNNGTYLYGYITNLVPRLSLLDGVICPSTRKRFEPHYKDLYYESDVGRRSVDRGFICPQTGERIPYDGERGDTSQPLRGEMGTDFWLGGRSVVGDLAFEADITPQVPTGSITVTIGRGQETSTRYFPQSIALPIGGGFEPHLKNIDGVTRSGSAILKEGVTTHVSFSSRHGVSRYKSTAERCWKLSSYCPGETPRTRYCACPRRQHLGITLDNVTIKRDIYYLAVDIDQSVNPYLVSKGIYKVPEGRLFMLGDNSAASNDCRLKLMPVLFTTSGDQHLPPKSGRHRIEVAAIRRRVAAFSFS